MARVGIRMTRGRWLLVGGIAIVVVVSALWLATRPARDVASVEPGPSSASPATASPDASAPTTTAAIDPTATAEPIASPSPDPTPARTPTSAPTAEPTPTDPPIAHGDPRLLYAEFLLRVNDDRGTVERLNDALGNAAQAQDPKGVHDASVDILDFADGERDWLREHPPASCYAKAHRAAGTMVADYGDAAERFLDWAETGGGLAGLTALQPALDAVDVATASLTAFGRALDATTCPR